MTQVDWTLICRSAYFDRDHRLTMFDVETERPVPRPPGTQPLSLVVHLREREAAERLVPVLLVTTPHGSEWLADHVRDFCVEHRANFVVLHMPSVVFHEEGVYHFELTLGSAEPIAIDVMVQAPIRTRRVCVHGMH